MEFKDLPSPDALKRIMLMIGVQRLVDLDLEEPNGEGYDDVCELADDLTDDVIELRYDKEKETYEFSQIPEGDEEYLYFAANKKLCLVATMCTEGGEELPKDEIPQEVLDLVSEWFSDWLPPFNIFAWSTDGKTWIQPESGDFTSTTFDETVLDRVLEDFPGFDEEQFRKACPVWYQVYKQAPFDNDMLLEAALLRELSNRGPQATKPKALAALKLPETTPATTAKLLKHCFDYPTDLREDYQPALTEAHVQELIDRGFYALAAYCINRMLAEQPNDAALKQKADKIYPQVQKVVSTQKIYGPGEGDDYDDEDYDDEDE